MIARGLQKLGFTPNVDFIVQDESDGAGPYIRAWLSGEPQPGAAAIAAAAALPDVPAAVSPLQARRGLTQAGLRQAVEDWIATQPQDVRDAWEFATQIRRDDALIAAAAAALSLTHAQIDDLFILAATL